MQAVPTRQKGNSLEVPSNVSPLRGTMRFFTREEQRDRCSEELIVASILFVSARLVFARNTNGFVKKLSDLKSPSFIEPI